MREILFRGKPLPRYEHETHDKWVYGGLVHQTDWYGDKVDDYYIIDGTGTHDYDIGFEYKVFPESVGQYTGLTDKNGRKIFEGDIISLHQFLFDGSEYEKEILASIEYIDDTMCFGLNLLEAEEIKRYMGYDINSSDKVVVPFNDFCGLHEESCEVIGNIYDNPRLLLRERE